MTLFGIHIIMSLMEFVFWVFVIVGAALFLVLYVAGLVWSWIEGIAGWIKGRFSR